MSMKSLKFIPIAIMPRSFLRDMDMNSESSSTAGQCLTQDFSGSKGTDSSNTTQKLLKHLHLKLVEIFKSIRKI